MCLVEAHLKIIGMYVIEIHTRNKFHPNPILVGDDHSLTCVLTTESGEGLEITKQLKGTFKTSIA